MNNNQTTEWHGLRIVGDIVDDDWEGDPSVPNGTRHIPPYVQDLEVYVDAEESIVNYLNDEGIDFFCAMLIADCEGEDDERS